MIEQDYVDFCNLASNLRKRAQDFFARYGDEHIGQLDGLVRMERAGGSCGAVEPAYDFVAGILREEAVNRRVRRPLIGCPINDNKRKAS